MAAVLSIWAPEEQRQEGLAKPLVHIIGAPASGFDTLCGHCDRTDFRWVTGSRKVNCRPCLRIWKFVKDGEHR